jgi:hypothetical protein
MAPQDTALLAAGAGLAAIGLGCMLLLFPLLGVGGNTWMVLTAVLGLAGVGLTTLALRERILIAGPAAAAVAALVMVVGVLRWEPSKTPDQLADELLGAMSEMATQAESIRDEATLQRAGASLVALFSRILKIERTLRQAQAPGSPLAPEKAQAIDKAVEDFGVRMAEVARRLPGVPGGTDLARRLARVAPRREPPAPESPPEKRASTQPGGSASSEANERRLMKLDDCLRMYVLSHSKAADGWDALEGSLQHSPNELALVRQLRAEGLVVQWGVTHDETVHFRRFVRAYGKDAPQQGGLILVSTTTSSEPYEVEAEELRELLNDEAPGVKSITGAAPPTWPTDTAGPGRKRGGLTVWIPWGWMGPASPPEPAPNLDRRARAMEKAGRDPKAAVIHLQGVARWTTARDVERLIMDANGGIGPLEFRDRSESKLPWEFTCGNVEDIRRLAFMLDIGPVTGIDEAAGVIRAKLDLGRVRELSRARQRPSRGLAAGPPPPVAPPQRPPGDKLPAVTVPLPPEPPENVQRRSQARRSAGLDSMARGQGTSQPPGELSVEVGVRGMFGLRVEKGISDRLQAIGGGTVGSTRIGGGVVVFQLSEVRDIRVLASKIDFGTIVAYDEEHGRIGVEADPAKIVQMARAGSSAAPSLAGAKPGASSTPGPGRAEPSEQPGGTTAAGSPQPGAGPTGGPATDSGRPSFFRPPFGPRGPRGGPGGPEMGPPPGFAPPGFGFWTGSGPAAKPGPGRKTELVGAATEGSWNAASNAAPVLGFDCPFDASAVPKGFTRFDPVFARDRAAKDAVLAREGYAVGGLVVDADQHVQAVQVIFMRIRPDGKLDPADKYTSEWIGQRSDRPPRTIGGDGAKVTGAYGRRGRVINAVGLIQE